MARKKKAKPAETEVVTEAAEVAPEGWMSAEDLPPLPTEPVEVDDAPADAPDAKAPPRYVYRHPACDGNAFFIDHMPHPGELLKRINVRFEDGTTPGPGTLMLCGHCGLSVGPLQTRHVREL